MVLIRERSTLALMLLLLAAPSRVSVAQDLAAQRARRVDSLFSRFDSTASPGLAVAVVREGRVLLSKGYGLASLEQRVPITSSTVFDVASVSKQFTGLAVAMLVAQGKVGLRDDIRRYIPELRDQGRTITIDHLLHHTSGLRDWAATLAIAGWRFDDVISFDQILWMAFRQATLNFAPGEQYSYSNTEYNLLAEMVARVTGQSFRAWTDEHIFGPLGMTRTHFRDDHTQVIPQRAFSYARASDGSYHLATDNLTALGSSSLFSTADDLAKWVMNFDHATVGGDSAMALMRTRGVLNDGSVIPYAFGVFHGEHRGLPTISHDGSWASFRSLVVDFPLQHCGVVVLANTGSIDVTRAAYAVADIVLGKELAPLAAPGPAAQAVEVAPDILETYVGLYRLGPGWYVRIRREGTELKTRATREPEYPMTPRSDSEFWVEGYHSTMVFNRGSPGDTTYLTYRGKRYPKLAESEPLTPAQLAAFAGQYDSDELQTSYGVEVRDSSLVMQHPRYGAVTLTRLWRDEFAGSPWFMNVQFLRDEAGRVVGLAMTAGDRSRNNRFDKRR